MTERPGTSSDGTGSMTARPGTVTDRAGTVPDDAGTASIWPGTVSGGQKPVKNGKKPGLAHSGAFRVGKKRQLSRFAVQLLDFLRQPFRLQFQLRIFNLKLLHPFRRQFIQHARLLLGKLAQFVIGTGAQLFQ